LLSSNVPAEHQWQAEAEQQRLLYVAMTRACGRLYLPFAGYLTGNSGNLVCKVSDSYSFINDQLSTIKEQLSAAVDNSPFSSSIVGTSALYKQENVNEIEQEKLRKWKPTHLPVSPIILDDSIEPGKLFNQLRYKKRGFVLSSFSRMNRKKEALQDMEMESALVDATPVEIRTEIDLGMRRENDETNEIGLPSTAELHSVTTERVDGFQPETNKDPLPGGVQTGNMLHELLELVDFNTIQASNSPQEWLAHPSVYRLLDSFRERYGRSVETLPRVAEIIWSTLRVPVKLGESNDALELADSERFIRETDFYFPIPFDVKAKMEKVQETQNYSWKVDPKVDGWKVEKGFLRGSIDFLFEHKGLIYLLDWKSNLLSDYHVETLEQEVKQHYELQLQIYTLATSYWFKLDSEEKYNEKFGGVLYIFLRGMPQHKGVYFKRPSWQNLNEYENRLRLENY